MDNKELKAKYDEMHKQGSTSWFSDGREERETILKMGEPWKGLEVLEIGCGEGDLANMLDKSGSKVCGIDYSETAIEKANEKYPELEIFESNYRELYDACIEWGQENLKTFDRLVMQGVLEHLDDPFAELKWMMDNLLGEHGDVITSSPCFLNPRGIVWMTLDMLGAVMSKTDLHYLDPDDFQQFCSENSYMLNFEDCDILWGNHDEMIADLKQRIPLALKDGNLPIPKNLDKFLDWLSVTGIRGVGATMVYRITK